MKTIAVANQKGGCGKTTTTINLAGSLANIGKRTLVIDLDPQAHASFGLGATNQAIDKSIYNVMTDNPEKRRLIDDCIVKLSSNIDIVPSNILLSTLEQELKDKDDAVSRLYQALHATKLNYDYALIDCPPSLGFLTFNALRAAELVLVPIDMSAFSLMGVSKLLGMLELIKIKIYHAPQVSALATIYDKRTKYSKTMLDEIKSLFKDQMLETIIRVSVALKKAAAEGVPVIQFDSESHGAADYNALAQELLKGEGAAEFEKAMSEVASPAAESAPETAAEPESDTAGQDMQRVAAVADTAAQDSADRAIVPVKETGSSEETEQKKERFIIRQVTTTDSPQSAPSIREAIFTVNAPKAREIHVVGDFNQWKVDDSSRLSESASGRWEKRLALQPGRYKYKFVVDGEWKLDEHNGEKEQNPFGTFDSIIHF